MPQVNRFGPLDGLKDGEYIVMTVDEYETIRLLDLEKMKQEECAENMNVARTTVTAIYMSARSKIADSIVNGRTLIIQGGDYMLCDGHGGQCGRRGCHRRHMHGRIGENNRQNG